VDEATVAEEGVVEAADAKASAGAEAPV